MHDRLKVVNLTMFSAVKNQQKEDLRKKNLRNISPFKKEIQMGGKGENIFKHDELQFFTLRLATF